MKKTLPTECLGLCAALLGGMVFLMLLNPWPMKPGPLRIDLRGSVIFMKRGFHPEDLNRDPTHGEWDAVLLNETKKSAMVRDYMPEKTSRRFMSPRGDKPREYTFVIPFTMDSEHRALLEQYPPITPGLFLASVGDNWQLFLNGVVIQSEMYLDQAGNIRKHRSLRSVSVPLRHDLFHEGENYIGMRIVGAPSFDNTGMYYRSPYFIDEYQQIRDQAKNQSTLI